jgi:UDP-N-acetyl-D-glucosamine dehydrogenase
VLNDAGRPVKGARILILGVSYKAGVGDVREAPALKIIELLRERGADVTYHDAHVPELPQFGLSNVELEPAVAAADLAVVVTAHPGVDHEAIATKVPLVLDLRGVTRRAGVPGVTQL